MDQGLTSFLRGYEDLFLELGTIRKANGVNSKGNPVRMTMCPLGINTAVLREVKLKDSKGILFAQLVIQPHDRVILGERHKIAPISTSVFRPEEMGVAYGHTFKPRPSSMANLEYWQHICRRILTWVDQEVKISVIYDKALLRDAYGKIESEGAGNFANPRVVYYPRIQWNAEFSWSAAIQMTDRDKKDLELWYKENRK